MIVEGWGVQAFVNTFTGNNPNYLDAELGEEKTANSVELIEKNFSSTRFFHKLQKYLYLNVFSEKLLYFSTEGGYSKEILEKDEKFNQEIIITGTSKTKAGKEFVSMMEHRKYPILATVFLTERTQFERHGPNIFLPRDERVIDFSFNFMMSIVN